MPLFKKNPKIDSLFLPGVGLVGDEILSGAMYAQYVSAGLLVPYEPQESVAEPEPEFVDRGLGALPPEAAPPPSHNPAELSSSTVDNLPSDKAPMNESVEPVNSQLLIEPSPGASGLEATEDTKAGMLTETLPLSDAPSLTESASSKRGSKKSAPWEKK